MADDLNLDWSLDFEVPTITVTETTVARLGGERVGCGNILARDYALPNGDIQHGKSVRRGYIIPQSIYGGIQVQRCAARAGNPARIYRLHSAAHGLREVLLHDHRGIDGLGPEVFEILQ